MCHFFADFAACGQSAPARTHGAPTSTAASPATLHMQTFGGYFCLLLPLIGGGASSSEEPPSALPYTGGKWARAGRGRERVGGGR